MSATQCDINHQLEATITAINSAVAGVVEDRVMSVLMSYASMSGREREKLLLEQLRQAQKQLARMESYYEHRIEGLAEEGLRARADMSMIAARLRSNPTYADVKRCAEIAKQWPLPEGKR